MRRITNKTVQSNKDLIPVARSHAESVYDFYSLGMSGFIEVLSSENDDAFTAFASKIVTTTNGELADISDSGEHDDASDWLYEMTFHLTPDGLAGDIVTYVKSGTAFFFRVNPKDGIRLSRVKPCCPECRATSDACACL